MPSSSLSFRYKERTGHYIVFWGVPGEIHVRKELGTSSLAILEFPPRSGRSTWRYATNGMSEYVQTYEGTTSRTELFACTSRKLSWVVSLLDALARYPSQEQTLLGAFDTVAVGQPIDRDSSAFSAVLLAPPHLEADALGVMAGLTDEPIHISHVIGIFESECAFAVENGGAALYARLRAHGSSFLLDALRTPVV